MSLQVSPRSMRWGALILLALAALTWGACGKKTPQERLQKARQLNQQQKPLDALIELRRLQQDLPGDPIMPDVLLELARTHAILGQYEQAEQRFKEVLERAGFRDQRGQAAAQNLIAMYHGSGRLDAAISTSEEYLTALPQDDPSTRGLLLSIAQLNLMKGDHRKAAGILEQLRSMLTSPDDLMYVGEFLAVAYASDERFDDAVEVYDSLITIAGDTPMVSRIQIGKAFYLERAGRTAEADALTSQAIGLLQKEYDDALDPEIKIRIKMEMARALDLLKKDAQAEAVYLDIIRNFANQPDIYEIYEVLAEFYTARKQWDKARAVLEEERAKFPSPRVSERITAMMDRLEAMRLRDESTTPTQSANVPQDQTTP